MFIGNGSKNNVLFVHPFWWLGPCWWSLNERQFMQSQVLMIVHLPRHSFNTRACLKRADTPSTNRAPKPTPNPEIPKKTPRLRELFRKVRANFGTLPWHESGTERSDELFYFGWIFFLWTNAEIRENQTCTKLRSTISRHLLPPISRWGKAVDSYRRSCRNSKTSHRKGGGRGGFRYRKRADSP